MDNFTLDDILNNDPLDVLKTSKVKNPIVTPDDRLIASFQEINKFYKDNGSEPKKSEDVNEITLYSRLKGIRKNQFKIEILKKYDKYNLLKNEETVKFDSIDDILNNDNLGIFDNKEEDIFTLKNIPKIDKNRAKADYVAKRKKCENFEKYEHLFIQCQKDLKDGKRKLIDSIESKLEVGTFCVLDGVLLYIAHIEKAQRGNSNKLNRRTTLIFENMTKSNMLHRSLGKRLKDNGKMVTKLDEELLKNLDQTNDKNKPNGYIYILESLSNNDKITTKKDLYKIGFSTTSVEQRIKNAKNDPTYLMANVKIIQTYEVYDANPHKLEKLIHKFFSHCCLNVDIVDAKGNLYNPKEWFIVPLNIIEEAIELIKKRKILNYEYDYEIEKIIEK